MATQDLTKLKHSLVNTPLHFYSEVKNDGTEVLRHIRVQRKVYQVPADGITIDTLPPDIVGTEEIMDGGVHMEDLDDSVKENMADRVSQEDLDKFKV